MKPRRSRHHRERVQDRFRKGRNFLAGARNRNRRLLSLPGIGGLSVITAVFISAIALTNSPSTVSLSGRSKQAISGTPAQHVSGDQRSASSDADKLSTVSEQFSQCGLRRVTCVVDGDTFWLHNEKIRIADIDTPEVSRPRCAEERVLGDRATRRLVTLLNDGPFELSAIGGRDEDQYGRKLRVLLRNGRSLGDQMVSEGVARTWTGRREPWC